MWVCVVLHTGNIWPCSKAVHLLHYALKKDLSYCICILFDHTQHILKGLNFSSYSLILDMHKNEYLNITSCIYISHSCPLIAAPAAIRWQYHCPIILLAWYQLQPHSLIWLNRKIDPWASSSYQYKRLGLLILYQLLILARARQLKTWMVTTTSTLLCRKARYPYHW